MYSNIPHDVQFYPGLHQLRVLGEKLLQDLLSKRFLYHISFKQRLQYEKGLFVPLRFYSRPSELQDVAEDEAMFLFNNYLNSNSGANWRGRNDALFLCDARYVTCDESVTAILPVDVCVKIHRMGPQLTNFCA